MTASGKKTLCHDTTEANALLMQPDATSNADAVISNAIVSNDSTYFGLVENPDKAHTGYIHASPVANTFGHDSGALYGCVGSRCVKQQ